MGGNARATTFVTGADGFLGTELVKLLVFRGHRVVALTRSIEGAETMRRIGAVPVIGDLLTPGRWQDEAAADWVLHLSPPPADRGRTFLKRAATMARARLPAAATRFAVGPAWAEYPQADAVLSNIRLRGIGFRFGYPTLEDGVGQVLRDLHE
jgi:uncharacterized protein YbjT (DUF2867 family)